MGSNARADCGQELPKLPRDWRWTLLREHVDPSRGICYGIVQPGRHDKHGVPMVNTSDVFDGSVAARVGFKVSRELHNKFRRSVLHGGEILVTLVGANFGRVAVAPPSYAGFNCSRAVGVVPALVDVEYLMFALRSPIARHLMDTWANTTAQPTFNLKDLGNLPVPMPPAAERDGISATLSALDDRIDLLRQTNTTLEAIAQALFKSWFVDFDPVHAKAEGREPEAAAQGCANAAQGRMPIMAMGAATAALFPSEFEESDLGAIPKGWRVDEIGNVVRCLGGATPSTKEDAYWIDGEHHWVTPKDLAGLQAPILIATSRQITDAGLSRISSGLLPPGTLLMSSRAPIGYLALAGIPTAINQGFIAMLPGGTLPPVYLFFWTRANMDSIKQQANGSTFMEISKSSFRPIKLCVPPPKLVDAFAAAASPLIDRIETNEHHRIALTELRDTLLPRLISGKLRLPESESLARKARV